MSELCAQIEQAVVNENPGVIYKLLIDAGVPTRLVWETSIREQVVFIDDTAFRPPSNTDKTGGWRARHELQEDWWRVDQMEFAKFVMRKIEAAREGGDD